MGITILDTDPPPAIRRRRRLTQEMKAVAAGQSFVTDHRTAHAYVMWCSYQGFEACRKKVDANRTQVWRLR